jgi:hypothetical protein
LRWRKDTKCQSDTIRTIGREKLVVELGLTGMREGDFSQRWGLGVQE